MSVYIYCPRKSQGALELVKALDARRIRRFDGLDLWDKKRRTFLEPGDAVIAWGAEFPEFDGIKVLNGGADQVNKYEELRTLANAGLPAPGCYLWEAVGGRDPGPSYLKRSFNHVGGADLLAPKGHPDYIVQTLKISEEYRIHSFLGKSIRAGIKIPREGLPLAKTAGEWRPGMVHPWIRSFDGGWRINYDGFKSVATLRGLAHKAVTALGLDFGAVDLGKIGNNTYVVLEVNRAPGLEGNSVASYARAITKWLGGAGEVVEV